MEIFRISKAKETTSKDLYRMLTFDEFNRIIGVQAKYVTEKRYAVTPEDES